MNRRIFLSALWFKTWSSLKLEVARYYLNYLWWILEPVLMMSVFYLVFGVFMESSIPNFPAFLLVGLTAWNWFSRTVNNAALSLVNGCNLMNQVDIPKLFFPLQVFLQDFIKHLFVFSILLIFLLMYKETRFVTWITIPLLLLIQAVFIAGVAALAAAVIPFVPDLKFVVNTGLLLMFFSSGIFYDVDHIKNIEYREIMYFNPMTVLLKAYRDVLVYGNWPNPYHLAYASGIGLILLMLAIWLISRNQKIYPRIC